MSDVAVADATFTYASGDAPALRGVSCRLEAGSFLGVAGPADAGKTTFCRLLPGFVPGFFDGAFEGSVTVGGVDVPDADVATAAESVGFVLESPRDALTGAGITVLEEVAFGLEQRGVAAAELEPRAREALDRVGAAGLADRDPGSLSGGQLQRVAVACALVLDPPVLVLDEPTAELDPAGTERLFELASAANREGRTVVLASNHLAELAPRADRLLVLDGGRTVADGPPREVLAAPRADGLLRLPPAARLGRGLRDRGLVPADRPLPLDAAEAAAELRAADAVPVPAPAPDATPTTGTTPGSEPAPEPAPGSDLEPESDSTPGAPAGGRRRAATGGGNDDDGDADADASASAAEGPLVALDGVRHVYDAGDVEALAGVDLSLDPGDAAGADGGGACVAFVGRNGAGKTTLVRHLNGLLEPAAGRVVVDGVDTRAASTAELARTVGLAFQEPDDQLFRPTVGAEVRFGPENLDRPDPDALVDAALERLRLADVRDVDTYELGRPVRRRVAVAGVLAMDTPVVVLDEPTGGQDATGVAAVGDAVESLVADGRLVVVVTHDVEFAARHADRVVAMADGRVVADGTPAETLADDALRERVGLRAPFRVRLARELGLESAVGVESLLAAV